MEPAVGECASGHGAVGVGEFWPAREPGFVLLRRYLGLVPGLGTLPAGGQLLARECSSFTEGTDDPVMWSYQVHGVVPEPASLILLATGAAVLLLWRWRRSA